MENIVREMEKMSMKELIELNKLIAQKVKALSLQEGMEASAKYRVGQEIEFTDKKGKKIAGVVLQVNPPRVQVNPTTVDLLCDGEVWTVSANLLSP